MITARRNGRHVARNASWFQRVVPLDVGTNTWPRDKAEEDIGGDDAQMPCREEAQRGERCSTSPERARHALSELVDETAKGLPKCCEKYNLWPNHVHSQRL
ncbi:hypothetical protein NDU88_003057 [Pleurodeles waltl]|uniref:Uncharacterized protein n=1 Tax=Pleurodeles waltl TaxID=8319 RepID=A0AAV7PDL6_PLEWA|nr:hypothetical protein NDU88_003057 [Pleurodeles waltl]